MIEEAIHAILSGDAALSAQVSGRIFWGDRLQGNGTPALVHSAGESVPVTASGAVRSCDVELAGIADTAGEADAIAQAAAAVIESEPAEAPIGSTGHALVAVSGRRVATAEPEPAEGEARAEAVAVVSLTVYYRG